MGFIDALRDRTTVPVVLYDDDVDADTLRAFLDVDGTDFVRRHPSGSDVVLAKRVQSLAEHATLVESHGLLERAVDQADVGITIADARADDEPLIYVNGGFERLTGYPADETIGRNCRFLQGEDTDPETVATLREAIEAERAVSVDLLNYRLDGTEFWNHLDLSPIFDDDELTHYFGFQRDVTERKRLAEALREQNERLAAFASVVSHDLRNPLAVARGHLEGDVDEASVESALDALDRMESLIADVLALAREGDAVEDVSRVSLREVATYAWSMVETDDLDLVVPEDEPVIVADRARLVSLLENCFRNAVEHASGATTVHVTLSPDGFVVADDGPGIPESEREAVFERGYSTTDDGTGFGLAIVAAIADAHDWTASIETSADGGTAIAFENVEVVAGSE
jgi:PAS domain S-box-containing protein